MSAPRDEAKRERIRAIAREMIERGQIPRLMRVRDRTGSGLCTVREVLAEMRAVGEFEGVKIRHKARKRSERLATKRRVRMGSRHYDDDEIERVRETIRRMEASGERATKGAVAAATGVSEAAVCRIRAKMVAAGTMARALHPGRPRVPDEARGRIRAAFLADPTLDATAASRSLGLSRFACQEIRRYLVEDGLVEPARKRKHRKAPVDPGEHTPVEIPYKVATETPDPRPRRWHAPDDMAEWLPAVRRRVLDGDRTRRGCIPRLRDMAREGRSILGVTIPHEDERAMRMHDPEGSRLPVRPLKSRLLYPEECQP